MAGGPFDDAERQYAAQSSGAKSMPLVRLYWIPAHGRSASGLVFSDTQIPVPAVGTWQLRARSGSNAGCFTVTFTR